MVWNSNVAVCSAAALRRSSNISCDFQPAHLYMNSILDCLSGWGVLLGTQYQSDSPLLWLYRINVVSILSIHSGQTTQMEHEYYISEPAGPCQCSFQYSLPAVHSGWSFALAYQYHAVHSGQSLFMQYSIFCMQYSHRPGRTTD